MGIVASIDVPQGLEERDAHNQAASQVDVSRITSRDY
jgi:hypothetical protein